MARLCAAGIQLRNQLDDDYPNRDRKSDGWIADARHLAKGSSDHIPVNGIVRALDIDADLSAHKEEAYALVEKIRKLAKKGDKRIAYTGLAAGITGLASALFSLLVKIKPLD